jgi:hypothetical protein
VEKRCKLNVIGLGAAGCNIADKFSEYPQYNIYKIDVGLKGLKKNGIYAMPEQDSVEEYEKKCPSLKNFFKNVSGEVLFIVCGAGKISGASLRILEEISHCNIEILYVMPDVDLLGYVSVLRNKVAYNILQEYARSGLFSRIYIVSNFCVQDIFGDTPIINYYDKLNEMIVSTFHMINVFRFSKSIINTFSAHIDSCRISTFGMFDQEKNEEKLFFPLENIRELMYYYGVPRQILEEDGRLFRKITDQIKVKSTTAEEERVQCKATFGVYQTQYEENYNFIVASTSFIQKSKITLDTH